MPIEPDQPPHRRPRLLEVSHVAHRLSVGDDYVLGLIHGKKLAAILLGTRWRIDPVDLEAFIDKNRTRVVG